MSLSRGGGRRGRAIQLGSGHRRRWVWVGIGIAAAAVMGSAIYINVESRAGRLLRLREYWADPAAHADWEIRAGDRCGEAPFVFPTDGYVGFVWGDSFRPGHAHQGLDIFGPTGPDGLGQTPVVAAYDGYLTRRADWRSAVILRIPQDPFQPGRQIWAYYTHMADAEGNSFVDSAFPPGTSEEFVRAGTLLGYQGNYSADPMSPTGMHLHFSIVRDDGEGRFLNELEIDNTLDPSPYLGIEVDARRRGEGPPVCKSF
ncbi:MAG TPA: M23 family metallopeptidase [Anaerolineales bacterium]|nr:M23 family metallopeptidase [Anaerolineales bacterium]